MVVIWHDEAKRDLKNYSQHSKVVTDGKVKKYITDLADYANTLECMPNLGKDFIKYKGIVIKQLLFNMHRIFYYIENNEIIIIHVVHTSMNIDTVIKNLYKMFN